MNKTVLILLCLFLTIPAYADFRGGMEDLHKDGLDYYENNSGDDTDHIQDADGDTKIQVEESADEDKIRFDTAGSEVMIIDENGNVGIGTTGPGESLHIFGSDTAQHVRLEGTGQDVGIRFEETGSSYDWQLMRDVANDYMAMWIGSNFAETTNAMTWTTSGNVGIGTTNPGALLEVYDNVISTLFTGDNIIMKNHYTGGGWARNLLIMEKEDGTDYFRFGGFGSGQDTFNYGYIGQAWDDAAIKWDSANEVGIGMAGSSNPALMLAIGDANTGLAQTAEDTLHIYTGGTERVTVNSVGNVGIGTTSPGAKLEVTQDQSAQASSTPLVNLPVTGTAAVTKGAILHLSTTRGTGTDDVDLFRVFGDTTGTSPFFTIRNSGNVGIGTTGPLAKLDIAGNIAISGAIGADNEILKMNGATLGWEADETGAGSGAFSDAGDPVVLNTTTKDVHIGDGAGTLTGKVEIGGDADQPQLVIEGFGTQTDAIFIVQNDADTELAEIDNSGNFQCDGTATVGGAITEAGNAIYSLNENAEFNNLTLGDNSDADFSITFDSDTSDGIISFDEDNTEFEFDTDVNVNDDTPHMQLIDTDGSQDDFEITADDSQAWISNVTDSIHYVRMDEDHNVFVYDEDAEIADGVRVSGIKHWGISVDPGAWYDSDNEIFIAEIGDDFPYGIYIDEWKTSCNVDPDVEVTAKLKFCTAWIGLTGATEIDTLTTTTGTSSEDTDSNIYGGAVIPNGSMIYISFESTDPEGTAVQWHVDVWYHDAGN